MAITPLSPDMRETPAPGRSLLRRVADALFRPISPPSTTTTIRSDLRPPGRGAGVFVQGSKRSAVRAVASRPPEKRAPSPVLPVGSLAQPRKTIDSQDTYFGLANVIVPPISAEESWKLQSLDDDALRSLSPARLMTLLADLSPDVSRGLYDFLRLCNPGWTFTALQPQSGAADPRAQATLIGIIAHLEDLYGSVDVVWNRLFAAAWLRGAFFSELVFAPDYSVADLAAPDPITVRFRTRLDPVRGQTWEIGQVQPWTLAGGISNNGFVTLDYPTIRYVPVDPFPGSPYGRPLCSSALFTTLFLLGLLHDLRRVVAQQGYPRLDVELVMEKLLQTIPADEQDNPDVFRTWIEGSIADVQKAMAALKPDDTYVHTDVVKVNRPIGTVDATSLGGIDGLIKSLERMAARALKTMPLMMGITEGMSEASANRQWELQAAGVKALQHLCENMLQRQFTLALQMAGTPARVECRFAELRAAEALRDAQTLTLTVQNWGNAYDRGWVSQDEAAQRAVGHPADQPEPRGIAGPNDLAGQTGQNPAAAAAMTGDVGTGDQK